MNENPAKEELKDKKAESVAEELLGSPRHSPTSLSEEVRLGEGTTLLGDPTLLFED